jgi:hypothetical protein
MDDELDSALDALAKQQMEASEAILATSLGTRRVVMAIAAYMVEHAPDPLLACESLRRDALGGLSPPDHSPVDAQLHQSIEQLLAHVEAVAARTSRPQG